MRQLQILPQGQPVPKLGIITSVDELTSFDMIYIYHHLEKGALLDLVPDHGHYHNRTAVQVYFKGFKLGYLPEKISQIVSRKGDSGFHISAKVKGVDKLKYLPLRGLDIELSFA